MVGHFDKMTMNRGEAAMRAEFERLRPLIAAADTSPASITKRPPASRWTSTAFFADCSTNTHGLKPPAGDEDVPTR